MARVDAARQMMSVPRKGAEASGRLFLAKRCHELAKAGKHLAPLLDSLADEIAGDLSPDAEPGVRKEQETIRRALAAKAGRIS